MLKQDLTVQSLNQTDHYFKGKIFKKVIGLLTDELCEKTMK